MKVALVGNQNSGKTTLFNALTGSNQKIGNWPGVTIDRKEGNIRGTDITIVDLPGIYSLSPYTEEEEISRKFVFDENPDLIVNIVDATSIERSLYLTTQLLEMDCKVVVALNMEDMLEKKGLKINVEKLSKMLKTQIVSISALKNTGIEKLIEKIKDADKMEKRALKIYDEKIEGTIDSISNELSVNHKRFVSIKLLEGDKLLTDIKVNGIQEYINKVESNFGKDCEQVFANARYDFIKEVKTKCVEKIEKKESITDKIDRVLLNKWAAIPIFIVIMALVYFLSVGLVGTATVDLMDGLVSSFSDWFGGVLTSWGASEWSVSLLIDGVVAGIGAVIIFVPQLIIMFLCICLLETCGYMSRIAFMLDKLFRKIGLSGKSLIPFIVGSGCSVPAIMSCRTIEDEKEKRMTIMLTPFIPCSAKLPIIVAFASSFFGKYSALIAVSLYFMAILVIIVSSIIMRKFIFKGESTSFISELPEYKLPSPKYVLRDVCEKTWGFIKRAGTIILACSVVIWFLLSFNIKFQYGVPVEESMLAGLGNGLAWIFYPMLGEWNWAASVSAIQGLVAKEQVISSMSIIAGFGEELAETSLLFANGSIFSFFNSASAYAFMVFNLFSAPCFGAIGAMKKELGSTKRMLCAVAFQTGIAWVLACLTFGIGSLILLI